MDNNEEKQTYELIDALLKRKDPALVGIRKILRGKTDSLSPEKSFSAHTPEVFSVETEKKSRENETIFTDSEVETLEFEKKISLLEEIIKQKDEQIETVRKESFESGRAKGIAESREEVKAAVEEIEKKMKIEVQKRLAEQINQEFEDRLQYFKSLESDVYQAVVSIAKKVVAAEISPNSDLILSVVKRALSYISQRDGIKIRVSQDDYEYVKKNVYSFNRHNDGAYEIEVVADEHVKAGGCLIETNSTIVDAQVEKRTENVLELVEKIWNETKNSDISKEFSIINEADGEAEEPKESDGEAAQ